MLIFIGEAERLDFDDTLLEKLKAKTKHVDIEYPICGCGSTVFQLNDNEKPVQCMRKKKRKFVCPARTKSDAVALGRKVIVKSIGDVLARQLANEDTRNLMQYRHNFVHSDQIEDVFSGTNYQHLRQQGFWSGQHDVCIGLSCDGFTPSKSGKKSNLTMIMLTNYNLPPTVR